MLTVTDGMSKSWKSSPEKWSAWLSHFKMSFSEQRLRSICLYLQRERDRLYRDRLFRDRDRERQRDYIAR